MATVGYNGNPASASSSVTNEAHCPKRDPADSSTSLFYTPSVSGETIDTVNIYTQFGGANNSIDVGLYDVSSGNPSTLIYSTTVTTQNSGAWYSRSGLGWSLTSGTTYAIALANKGSGSSPRHFQITGTSGDGRRHNSTTLPTTYSGYDISQVQLLYANIVPAASGINVFRRRISNY